MLNNTIIIITKNTNLRFYSELYVYNKDENLVI